jgi:MoaA/NifB/PqqE/SkfB family radical SAM enzyme
MQLLTSLFRKSRFSIDPRYLAAAMPKTLWIELTSKCPYDCVFCTRKSRFGAGQDLDFNIYRSLLAELEFPEFIGLNYSGESIYYPHLIDAIKLASNAGASTELVTAFSSIPRKLLEAIVASGLDRLAVSLHTMDSAQYKKIYCFGTLEMLKKRIDDFFQIRGRLGTGNPRLDFCFVAIHENLDQLVDVARYAKHVGACEIFVHPVIGRQPILYDLSRELDGFRLQKFFRQSLQRAVAASRDAVPEIPITVLNPDIDPNPCLSRSPQYFAPPLPSSARIQTCDQSPFESVHVLANGDVVVCEVHDEKPLGNLRCQTLHEIWHGEPYQEFRTRYVRSEITECRECVWKMAYLPSKWKSMLTAAEGSSPQLLRGWHLGHHETVIWSKRESLLELRSSKLNPCVRIAGLLPRGPGGKTNTLRIFCNADEIGCIENRTDTELHFDQVFSLRGHEARLSFRFFIGYAFRPVSWGINGDTRDLGFALERIEILQK